MNRFFLGAFVPLLFMLTQLFAAPTQPPKLAQAHLTVSAQGGIRNPMREKPEGVIPVGQTDFFYFGSWDSTPTEHTLRVGSTTTAKGYIGTTWRPPTSLAEIGSSNAFFVLADGSGNVKWALSSTDGDFGDMAATFVADRIYVAVEVAPIRRAEARTNDILARWEWGTTADDAFEIHENFTNTPNPSDFIAPRYVYILEVSLDGKVLSAYKPFEDANPAATQGDIWYSVRRLLYVNNHLLLDGKISGERSTTPNTRYALKYGTPAQTIQGEKNGKQILALIDISNSAQPKVSQVSYVTDQEKFNHSIDAIHLAEDAIYFSMRCSNGASALAEGARFLNNDIVVAGQPGGRFLLKTDRELKNVTWVKKLPKGVSVNSIAHSGNQLYVSGDFDTEVMWGTTKLLNDNDADNLAFWGTASTADGALGQAQFIQAGYAENVGIAIAGDHVFWQFDHRITGTPGMGSVMGNRDLLFGDGKQYATEDNLSDENENWVAQMGFAVYNKNTFALEAFTHTISSKAYLTIIPTSTSVGRGSPYVSGNAQYVSFIAQSGAGDSNIISDIQLFDAAFPTPKAEGYGNFCAFYGTLQLSEPKLKLTVKASTEGLIKVSYYEGTATVSKTTEHGDLQINLERNADFTMDVTPNNAARSHRYKFDPAKIGTTSAGATFKLLADATMEVVFFDPLSLTIEEKGKEDGLYYHLYHNGKSIIGTPSGVQLMAEDLLRLDIVALGYTVHIDAEGATLVEGTTYKVTGDTNVKFTITYTKDASQWRTIAYTKELQPKGTLVVKVRGVGVESGTSIPLGTSVECMLLGVPLGYQPTMNVTGLTKVSERQQANNWGPIYFYDYKITDNATVSVTLEKDETQWHTIAFDASGTATNGKPYTLNVDALGYETVTPVAPNEKLPKDSYFACHFTTEGGACPTLTVTGARQLTGSDWDKHGAFVYMVEGDVQISVVSWEEKQLPVSIEVTPKKSVLGSVEMTYQKDGATVQVKNGDQIAWGTVCKIIVHLNPGCEINKISGGLRLKGLASLGNDEYKVEGADEVSVSVALTYVNYSFSVVDHEGITITAEKLNKQGGKKPITATTKLHYGDKVVLTVTNADEANQWVKALKLMGLEKVEGEKNTYTVNGNAVVEAEVVKLLPLTLKPSANAKYSVTYLEKAEEKRVAIEGEELNVKANEKTQVAIKITEVAAKHALQGVKPLTATPSASDPMLYTFELTEAVAVEVLTEALEYVELSVKCGENGKLQVAYTEKHATQAGEKSEEVKGEKKFTLEKGTTVKLKALPNEHFRLSTFTVGANTSFPQEGSVILSETTQVVVVFEAVTYPITAITHRGKGALTLTTLERKENNIDLKQGDLVYEGEKLKLSYKADVAFEAKPETLKVEGLKQEGDAYVVTGAVTVSMDFVPVTAPGAAEDALLAEVVVAPNPFDNQLRIMSYELRGEYVLLNAQGVVVRSGNMDGNEVVIETSNLTSGLYLLRLTAENGAVKTYRVVKQ